MRGASGAAIGVAIVLFGSAAALADGYTFSVPYTVTLPAGYSGSMTLTIRCAVGDAQLSFDPAKGIPAEGAGTLPRVSEPATIALDSAPGTSYDLKKNLASSTGASLPTGTATPTAQKQPSSGHTYSGTVRIALANDAADSADVKGGPTGVAPTNYLCWGVVGTTNAYTTPPLVKGTLPVVTR